jgi:hypothetical protein
MSLESVIRDMEALVRKLQRASDELRAEGKICAAARVESLALVLRDTVGSLENSPDQ